MSLNQKFSVTFNLDFFLFYFNNEKLRNRKDIDVEIYLVFYPLAKRIKFST